MIYHHSLSDLSTVHNITWWHTRHNGWSDCGYHYVIEIDGTISNGRDSHMVGAHSIGRNRDSIGVCICGDFRDHEPSVAQLESCQRIYHNCCRAYSTSLNVEFHRPHIFNLFEPTSYGFFNSCPGGRLDRADFLEIVKRGDPYAVFR